MSSRSILLLAALAAVALAPAALAQAPGSTLTVQIQSLPATAMSNGTLLAIPFEVHATVSGASPCLGAAQGTQYTIALEAKVTNSTGNSTRAQVNPKQITIAGPVLLPAAGGSAERTETVTLLINPGPYPGAGLNTTVHVTASFAGGNPGCTGQAAAPAAQDSKDVRASFVPPSGFGVPADSQTMPFPGAGLLLVALAAAAIVLRRK
jgi:hypothetical protein